MERDLILFDLDGTLADCSHRLHHISPPPSGMHEENIRHWKKDWRAFFSACDKDSVIEHMRVVFNVFSCLSPYEIWIVSGRSDECRQKTIEWLRFHGFHRYVKLIMRKEGDFTDDSILKVSWLDDGTIPKDRVLCVFDDRDRVVKSWRERGIPCMQVAEGKF